MILEVIDQGHIERIGVVNGSASKDIDGRVYIGGLPPQLQRTRISLVRQVRLERRDTAQAGRNCRIQSYPEEGLMDEKQETQAQVDYLLPYLQDLVQKLNEIEVKRAKSPFHIRFGEEEES